VADDGSGASTSTASGEALTRGVVGSADEWRRAGLIVPGLLGSIPVAAIVTGVLGAAFGERGLDSTLAWLGVGASILAVLFGGWVALRMNAPIEVDDDKITDADLRDARVSEHTHFKDLLRRENQLEDSLSDVDLKVEQRQSDQERLRQLRAIISSVQGVACSRAARTRVKSWKTYAGGGHFHSSSLS
jgi:hypothetical protein